MESEEAKTLSYPPPSPPTSHNPLCLYDCKQELFPHVRSVLHNYRRETYVLFVILIKRAFHHELQVIHMHFGGLSVFLREVGTVRFDACLLILCGKYTDSAYLGYKH